MALKSSMRILLVDHVIAMRGATKNMLSQVGFKKLIETDTGTKAWSKIEEGLEADEKIEFIITELDLSGMSGMELLTKVRSHPATKDVPVLIVTGDAEQSKIVEAVKAGANNFIVKPFSSQTLQSKIATIFQQNQKKAA